MAKAKKMMEEKKALEILEHFGEYDRDDILAAVRVVSSDPSQSEKLKQFFDNYDKVNRVNVPDKEYDKTVMIFRFSDKYKDKYVGGAKVLAGKVAREHEAYDKYSFSEIAVSAAVLRSVTSNNLTKKALGKLNTVFENKLKKQDVNTAISNEEAAAIEYYIANLFDGEKKQELQAIAAQLKTEYDVENGLDGDAKDLYQKDNLADKMLNSMNLYNEKGEVSEKFADLAGILDRIEISTEDKKGGEKIIDDKEIVRQHINMLFDSAKMEAHMDTISDPDFLAKDDKKQREILTDRVKEAFLGKIAMVGVASSGKELTFDDLKDEKKVKAWENERDEKAQNLLQDLLGGKELQDKIKLKTKYIVASLADTSVEVEKFASRLGNKFKAALGSSKNKLQARLKAFEPKARKIYGKAYDIAKAVAKNLKDNKWQHIFNGTATAAMHVTIALGGLAAAPYAIGGYALYSVAGNYVWPVIAERRHLKEEAAKNGQKLGFKESFAQAWNNKKNDKVYKARRRFGWLGGIVGAGAGLLGISQLGLSAVGAKVASGIGRSISSLSAQGMAQIYAKQDYKRDPSEANKAKLRNTRISTGLATIGAVIAVVCGSERINKDLTNTVSDSITDAANSADGINDAAAKGGLLSRIKNLFNGRSPEDVDSTSVADTATTNDATATTDTTSVSGEDLSGVSEFGGPKIPVDINSFSHDESLMANNSATILGHGNKEAGMAILENYYDAFRVGKIESLPDGVTPAQYVDVMIRLHGYPVHSEAVKLMHKEFFDCDKPFHPTEEQKQLIADAIKAISYKHGAFRYAVENNCGEYIVKTEKDGMFGQYIGKGEHMVNVDGETLPLRKLNRITGIDADCNKSSIHVKYGSLPCDKEIVEMAPTPKKATSEIIPAVNLPDLPDASMAENAEGYQTSGTYYPPIDRYTNYDASVQHITAQSFSENTVAQTIRANYAKASQAEGFSMGKFIKACGGELIDDDVDGNITFDINHGTVIDTKQGLLDADHGAHIQVSMKHEDFMRFAETGELPSSTKEVPLTDENYKAILDDDNFAYDQTKGDRAYFDTSVAGAEHFSTYAPVDFDTSAEVGQLSANNDIVLPTAQGNVVVHIDAKTGDITAMLGNKPVRFSSETQQEAEEALKGALKARYDVASLSLAAPEGTLAKKCEVAMQTGRAVAMEYNPNHSGNAIGRVNFNDYNGR